MSDKIIETLVTIATLDATQFTAEAKKLETEKQKTAQRIEKGAEAGDKKDKQRSAERSKRERKEAAQRRKDAQDRERQNADLRDQLVGIGRTAATMFLGFETIKGAINAFNSYTSGSAATGRSASNLGLSTKEFTTLGQAVKLAGGDAASAEQQFAQMQQSIFALMTQGQTSPLTNTFRTMGVYIRDAQGHVRGLTDLLTDLADKLEKRGLPRAQEFQWLQAAGINGDVANLLLDKNRGKMLAEAEKTANQTEGSTERSQRLLEKREHFKNELGALGNIAYDAATGIVLGDYNPSMASLSKAERGSRKSGSIYAELADTIGTKHGLPDGLLGAVGFQESRFNPKAYNEKSGATGIMQLIPKYHPNAGKDPEADIEEAAATLERLFKRFGTWAAALAAYNDGETDVASLRDTGRRSKKGHEGETSLPVETENYVRDILGGATPALAGATNTTHSNSVTTGDITIKTSANTLSGVGDDFTAAMRRKGIVSQSNSGMQ